MLKSFKQTALLSFLILICATRTGICRQTPDTTAKIVTIANTELKDCVLSENYIWVLRKDGTLLQIRKDNNLLQDTLKLSSKIVAVTQYANDTLFIATENGDVSRLAGDLKYQTIWNTGQTIRFILITSKKQCWLATDAGVYDPSNSKEYVPGKHAGNYGMATTGIGWDPSCTMVDSTDNIWLGYGWGEWGGDVVKFSTNQKKFFLSSLKDKLCLKLTPVHSFFQADDTVYVSASMFHRRSLIFQIRPVCYEFFVSGWWRNNYTENPYNNETIYTGAAAYNKKEDCFYFDSDMGIFKGNRQKDLSKISNWEMIIPVKAGGEGTRIIFSDDKAYFFHPRMGVIVWDGQQQVILKTHGRKH